MKTVNSIRSLSDNELLNRLAALVSQSRRFEAELVAHIAEVDERRLYAGQACSSMFIYAVEVLHLSEHEAYERITAARASRKYPQLLEMLSDGRLHLSGLGKLAPHLTEENCDVLLARATHKTKRQIEELLAEVSPKPDAPALMRKLPEAAKAPSSMPPEELGPDRVPAPPPQEPVRSVSSLGVPRPAVIEALAPSRYKIQFTASGALRDKLERLHGRGGDHDPSRVRLLCKTHNLQLAERDYGKHVIDRYRRKGGGVSEPEASYGSSSLRSEMVGQSWPHSVRTLSQ